MPNDEDLAAFRKHIQQRQSEIAERRLNLERENAKVDAEAAELERLQSRADNPPAGRVCLTCWMHDGITDELIPLPALDSTPDGFDLFKCRACGLHVELPA